MNEYRFVLRLTKSADVEKIAATAFRKYVELGEPSAEMSGDVIENDALVGSWTIVRKESNR